MPTITALKKAQLTICRRDWICRGQRNRAGNTIVLRGRIGGRKAVPNLELEIFPALLRDCARKAKCRKAREKKKCFVHVLNHLRDTTINSNKPQRLKSSQKLDRNMSKTLMTTSHFERLAKVAKSYLLYLLIIFWGGLFAQRLGSTNLNMFECSDSERQYQELMRNHAGFLS